MDQRKLNMMRICATGKRYVPLFMRQYYYQAFFHSNASSYVMIAVVYGMALVNEYERVLLMLPRVSQSLCQPALMGSLHGRCISQRGLKLFSRISSLAPRCVSLLHAVSRTPLELYNMAMPWSFIHTPCHPQPGVLVFGCYATLFLCLLLPFVHTAEIHGCFWQSNFLFVEKMTGGTTPVSLNSPMEVSTWPILFSQLGIWDHCFTYKNPDRWNYCDQRCFPWTMCSLKWISSS